MAEKIIRLFEGDMRCQNLLDSLEDLVYERAKGMSIPAIIGIIELLKIRIIEAHND